MNPLDMELEERFIRDRVDTPLRPFRQHSASGIPTRMKNISVYRRVQVDLVRVKKSVIKYYAKSMFFTPPPPPPLRGMKNSYSCNKRRRKFLCTQLIAGRTRS